jgi:hypothetical protein
VIRSRWQTATFGAAGISSLAALTIHGYLGAYSRYIADDFCSAGMARRLGVLRAVWYWYLNWTGRYSASALDAVFGLLGPAVTPFVTGLVLLVWLAALTQTIVALLRHDARSRILDAAVIACILVYVTLTLSPNVPQSLYWGQGMRSIVPPLILSTLLVAHVVRVDPPPLRGRVGQLGLVGSFLLALLIGGFNETFAALQLGALALACILSRAMPGWKTKKLMTGLLLAGVFGAATAVVIVVLSPGNAIRQAFYPPPSALPKLLEMAWANFGSFLTGLVRTPEKILAILGCLAVSAFMGDHLQQRQPSPWTAGIILAAGMGLAFASFVPAAYGLSDSPPERTLIVPAHLLTVTLACEGFFLGSLLGPPANRLRTARVATAVLLMACVLLVSSSALSTGRLLASRSNYIRYAEHWNAVDAQILSARDRGEKEIWIQPINNWAGLNEPNDNPKFWLNLCLREYYGIEVLGLDIP